MSKRQLLWVMAGCVQGTVCAGRSGDNTHVSARCWGSETRGVCGWGGEVERMGVWLGVGEAAVSP